MTLSVQPAKLGTEDDEGTLVFEDGRLVAVLSRLSDLHGPLADHWHVEAVFGIDNAPAPFPDIEDAKRFIAERLSKRRQAE